MTLDRDQEELLVDDLGKAADFIANRLGKQSLGDGR
jgi:hypothetical protein